MRRSVGRWVHPRAWSIDRGHPRFGCPLRVQPRARGGHEHHPKGGIPYHGLPPHMWGGHGVRLSIGTLRQGSPPRAGRTPCEGLARTFLRRFTRVRGGHFSSECISHRAFGSPARAGRTLLVERADFFFARFTPARGEDTATLCLPSWYVPVYPRARRTPGAAKSRLAGRRFTPARGEAYPKQVLKVRTMHEARVRYPPRRGNMDPTCQRALPLP